LVAHHVDAALASRASVTVHRVWKPAGSYFLSQGALNACGRRVAARITAEQPDTRVLVNGGNCDWPDINWVHCVHHVWEPHDEEAPGWFRAKHRLDKARARRWERRAIRRARVVLANSERTRRDVITHLQVEPELVHTV